MVTEKTFKIINGELSDGDHTFEELYNHRSLLFINLCLSMPHLACWKPDYEHWFCLYLSTPHGQISYHVQGKYLSLIEDKIALKDDVAFDGHSSDEVVQRLYRMAEHSTIRVWTGSP